MHGNCNENDLPYHLYAIDDLQEEKEFKFGISDDAIEETAFQKDQGNSEIFITW